MYPEPLFDPFDPRVTATIRKSRETYAEGILGYVLPVAIGKKGNEFVFNTKPGLHYWHTPDNAENALVRGGAEDQQAAVQDLYALLLHTTSTHAPQEFSTMPWSTRDYISGDILPDGAASGKDHRTDAEHAGPRVSGRPLLVFGRLARLAAAGEEDRSRQAEPTTFGPVSAVLSAGADGFEVQAVAPIPPAAAARGDSRAVVLRGAGGRGRRPGDPRSPKENSSSPPARAKSR